MDVDNVKLPWEKVLESYILHYESLRPDLDVRSQMSPIIEELKNNRIRSRAIMSSGEVVCYAFYVSPESMSDRYFGMVGFVSPEHYNPDRLANIAGWLIQEAQRDKKILMFNEIFNGTGYDEVLQSLGMKKIERVMLELQEIGDKVSATSVHVPGLEAENLVVSDVNELIRLHEMSYSGSVDSMLESTVGAERNRFWVDLFEGRAFGRYLQNGSMWAVLDGTRVGAIVTTLPDFQPLVADIFVIPEQRGKGIATFLLNRAVAALSSMGYSSVGLWVTRSNPAFDLYVRYGFTEVEGKVETIYFKSS